MDDEDDRRLLDILGDVDALNDYLHGRNSKSIEEEDVANAAYGSDQAFFNPTTKDGSSAVDFDESTAEAGLQLSFIEDELGAGSSPEEDQPFDILQKSLLEADITEQTLLDSQPTPTLVQASHVGGYGTGVVTAALNGSAPHIQVLGTLSGVLRPGVSAAAGGGFKNIPVQNIIIQRPIQPKPIFSLPPTTLLQQPVEPFLLQNEGAPAPVQTSRLTLIGPASPACAVQRLLVTQSTNCASPLQENSSAAKLSSIHDSAVNSEVSALTKPASPAQMILHHLRRDHAAVQVPDRRRFSSLDDALLRLLPYHVVQGAPPARDEFTEVDEEFQAVASQVLKRTEAMVNKYRRLLMVEAERSSPSSEIVMIDRTFNQEERGNLTQDKRMVLVDPENFLEDFCCGMKCKLFQDPSESPASPQSDQSELAYRTDPSLERLLDMKSKTPHVTSPPHLDPDSALEAAVNSILEC